MGPRYPCLRRENRKPSPKLGEGEAAVLLPLADAGGQLAGIRSGPPAFGSRGGVGPPSAWRSPRSRSSSACSELNCGSQPSCSRARAVSIVGTPRARSSQPGEEGCSRSFQLRSAAARRAPAGSGKLRAPKSSQSSSTPISGSAAMLKAPRDVAHDRLPVGLADVARVDRLEAQPRHPRHQRDQPLAGPGSRAGRDRRRGGGSRSPASALKIRPGRRRTTRTSGSRRSKASSSVSTAALWRE